MARRTGFEFALLAQEVAVLGRGTPKRARQGARMLRGPGHVVLARAVAGFARHVDFGPGRSDDPGGLVEPGGDMGRVALDAHGVGVHGGTGPVQPVAWLDVAR